MPQSIVHAHFQLAQMLMKIYLIGTVNVTGIKGMTYFLMQDSPKKRAEECVPNIRLFKPPWVEFDSKECICNCDWYFETAIEHSRQ